MNVRVEYEATPIRHIAVQCPKCENWFEGLDITTDPLSYDYHIRRAQFICPVCGKVFGADENTGYANLKITECYGSEVYNGCLRKKEVWE